MGVERYFLIKYMNRVTDMIKTTPPTTQPTIMPILLLLVSTSYEGAGGGGTKGKAGGSTPAGSSPGLVEHEVF